MKQIRQGDVQLHKVKALPAGCVEVPADHGRIVLAYGEVTGHAHAIDAAAGRDRAAEIADAAIARARLWRAPSGDRYLEVAEPVMLRHEEHTAHRLPQGIYLLPTQVEYTPSELRRVAD